MANGNFQNAQTKSTTIRHSVYNNMYNNSPLRTRHTTHSHAQWRPMYTTLRGWHYTAQRRTVQTQAEARKAKCGKAAIYNVFSSVVLDSAAARTYDPMSWYGRPLNTSACCATEHEKPQVRPCCSAVNLSSPRKASRNNFPCIVKWTWTTLSNPGGAPNVSSIVHQRICSVIVKSQRSKGTENEPWMKTRNSLYVRWSTALKAVPYVCI